MKDRGAAFNRVVKVIVGIVMLAVGFLFLARPVVTTVIAVEVAGILLVIIGAVELVVHLIPACRKAAHRIGVVTPIFMLFLGLLLLLVDRSIVRYLPVFVAIWLAAFGVYRVVRGVELKRAGGERYQTSVGIGVIAIVGAVMLAIVQWVAAVDMIGILIAVLAILYGFVVLLDVFVKTSVQSVAELEEEDREISEEQNAEFRKFQQKLKGKK